MNTNSIRLPSTEPSTGSVPSPSFMSISPPSAEPVLLEGDGPGLLAGLRVEIELPDAAHVGLRMKAAAGKADGKRENRESQDGCRRVRLVIFAPVRSWRGRNSDLKQTVAQVSPLE